MEPIFMRYANKHGTHDLKSCAVSIGWEEGICVFKMQLQVRRIEESVVQIESYVEVHFNS